MNLFYDANNIYEAGARAIAGSNFKQATQLFEMNQLLETAHLQRDLKEGRYEPEPGQKFIISERGKTRFITSNVMRDKTVNHVLCDEVLSPSIAPFVIYDNDASQKGKGVKHHRDRIEVQLHDYYQRHGNNQGWILLVDFSGYYPNIPHDKCLEVMDGFLDRSGLQPDEITVAKWLMRKILRTFELDVSRFSDEEIEEMMHTKIDPMMNVGVDPKLLTGKKMLRKGCDIGSQPSQNIGIIYPYRLDNYAKIVRGVKGYGRYTDDFHAIHESRGVPGGASGRLPRDRQRVRPDHQRKEDQDQPDRPAVPDLKGPVLANGHRQSRPENQPEERHQRAQEAQGIQAAAGCWPD